MGTRVFIPFGEFLPDRKLFGNEGLLRAFGVTPMSGNYIQAPEFFEEARTITNLAFGLGSKQRIVSGVQRNYVYYGSEDKLWEILLGGGGVDTDRSRATGYAFSTSPPGAAEMWWFTSFGENMIATNFEDEVQFLATPGSGLFANMITSTFKPQFRFVVPIRQNLFGFYAFLPAIFDGIPAGTHPQLGAWSMNDNIQVFGSENVDPAHIGAGYQQFIGGDLGPITAAIGGDFGLVFQAHGITRIDGPPYEFRTIVLNDTTLYPYSVFRLGEDVYFWGAGGPSVLRGGEAPVVRLGRGKLQRSLLDNVTGFGSDFAVKASIGPREISGGPDPVNELCRWAYVPIDDAVAGNTSAGRSASLLLDYSILDGRLSVSRTPAVIGELGGFDLTIALRFLRRLPLESLAPWGPFGGLYGIAERAATLGGTVEGLVGFELENEDGKAADMEIRTAFGRLSETHTSRIIAVRPIWSNTEGQAATIEGATEVQVHTKNKPWEDETDSELHSTFNEDGWIGTDSTVVGTYHSVALRFDSDTQEISKIHEIEGLEIEYVEGAEYGA